MSGQAGTPDPAVLAQLPLVVNRLIALMKAETEALRANPQADLSRFVDQKSRCHYEINLALEGADHRAFAPELTAVLRALKAAVEENVRALAAARGASEDILAVLSRAHQASTTDGTYSRFV
ncbi:MAG: hypothetical protein AAF940_04380 [Pseudomonadota bacterium]